MNRIINETTVKLYHYGAHDQLKQHLQDFLDAFNLTKRLKTPTPYEEIIEGWQKNLSDLQSIYFTTLWD